MTEIRIGDEERSRAADRLAEHAAAGRLTVEELEQRLERAHAAVYARDLRALEADLPGPPAPRPPVQVPWLPVLLLVAAVAGSFAVGHPLPPLFILAFLLWRRSVHAAKSTMHSGGPGPRLAAPGIRSRATGMLADAGHRQTRPGLRRVMRRTSGHVY